MHPILLDLPFGIFSREMIIRAYGIICALGFLAGIYMAFREARRLGRDPGVILDLSFWLIFAGMTGGRIAFILVNLVDYLKNPVEILRFWDGGFVWYGGLIGAIAGGWIFMAYKSMAFTPTADIMILGVPLGHAIGRIGCFMAGCCWGRPCSDHYPLGVIFTDLESAAPKNVHLHPVQLYEAAGELAIFALLISLRKRKKFEGQLFITYLAAYSILRFTLEFFRGDKIRGLYFNQTVSISQILSILVFLVAVIALAVLIRRGKK